MQVLFSTDHTIDGHERLASYATEVVNHILGRFDQHVTRIEVHLTDIDGAKDIGEDKRCVMEARIEGRPPVAVTHLADEVGPALDGAARKLRRALDTVFGKMREH
jgi:hypothetical protein